MAARPESEFTARGLHQRPSEPGPSCAPVQSTYRHRPSGQEGAQSQHRPGPHSLILSSRVRVVPSGKAIPGHQRQGMPHSMVPCRLASEAREGGRHVLPPSRMTREQGLFMNSVPLRDRAGFAARFVESLIAVSVVTFAAVAVATSAVAVSAPRAITRRTKPTTKVLQLLLARHLEDSKSESWGYEVATEIGLGVASVYPILRRLERAGWLLSRDENPGEARNESVRPPRTYFRVNPEHLGAIRQELAVTDARQRDAQPSAQGGRKSRALGSAG